MSKEIRELIDRIKCIKPIIKESVESEIKKLDDMGYKLVERFDFNDNKYTMLLLYNQDEDFYEVSLTSFENDFTTFDSQVKRQGNGSFIKTDIITEIKNKLNEWLDISPQLLVGTLNKQRAYVYNRLLSNIGFNVEPVKYNSSDENFPEFWDFNISINNG